MWSILILLPLPSFIFAQECLFVRPEGTHVTRLKADNTCVPTSANPWAYNQCCWLSNGRPYCGFNQISPEYPLPEWDFETDVATNESRCFVKTNPEGCLWLTDNGLGGFRIQSLQTTNDCKTIESIHQPGSYWYACCTVRNERDGKTSYSCYTSESRAPNTISVPSNSNYALSSSAYDNAVYCIQDGKF